MKTRIISSFIGLAILVAVLILGGPWFILGFWGVTVFALYEFFHALEAGGLHPIKGVGYLFSGIFPIYGIHIFFPDFYNAHTVGIWGITVFFFILNVYLMYALCVLKSEKYNYEDVALTIFSGLYISIPMFGFLPIYFNRNGQLLIWIIFLIAWGTDIFAYFIGVFFGKHKMMPALSPKKTWEGFFGGLLGATVLMTVYGVLVSAFSNNAIPWWIYTLLGLVLSLVSQFGDWFASSIKRRVKVKDFGNIMPGHGGLLDRFDSILVIVPFVYLFSVLYNG